MKKAMIQILFGIMTSTAFAQQAVLIEEVEVNNPHTKVESQRGSYLSESKKLSEVFSGGSYSDTYAMRAKRRVGVGFSAAGQMGMAGVMIELNYAVDDAAVVGFGGGPRYNSLSMQWKHVFGGKTIAPYTTLGYSRWYNSSNDKKSFQTSTPNILASKFLTEDEKKTGRFGKDIFTPSAGLQYNHLQGQYAGLSLFAEIVLLVNIGDWEQSPTGSVGSIYYF
ncbi:MAG: hypothetical protein BroJett040_08500 [Oligoflexia bacterium]|nr:MAG: hypothetical protein BroJett040_08500 [Oligoflexia bacterium]